jgi:hypothetical protein
MGLWQIVGALAGRCKNGQHKYGRWSRPKNGWKTRQCSRCGHVEQAISLTRARAAAARRKQAR